MAVRREPVDRNLVETSFSSSRLGDSETRVFMSDALAGSQ